MSAATTAQIGVSIAAYSRRNFTGARLLAAAG
jgi:hypothetical protein